MFSGRWPYHYPPELLNDVMIGGNTPSKTSVVSVHIYEHVEALEYAAAHWRAGGRVLC